MDNIKIHNLTTSYITHETGPSHLNTGFSIALESSRGTAIAYLPSPGKPTRSKRKARWSEVELALQQSGSQDREPKSEGCAEKVALLSSNGLTTHRTADARVFYKRKNDGTSTVLVLPKKNLDRHLSDLADDLLISDLMIPGTHDSLALHGWPISQCQEAGCTFGTQLDEGIRFFDIRLGLRKGVLLAFHGPWPQITPFRTMLEEVSAFLDTNPRETLIMCIQQEAPLTPGFSGTVREDMQKYIDKGQWFLEPRVPKLREVRGKGILMSRFGGGSGPDGSGPWEVDVDPWNKETKMGWKPTRWPDSVIDGFTWEIGETQVRTQDWYDIYGVFNIPAKTSLITDHLKSGSHFPSSASLTLSFTSASSLPFALPPFVANGFGWPKVGLGWRGVNENLKYWLLDRLESIAEDRKAGGNGLDHQLRGILPMDFYRKAGLVDVIIAFNTFL